MPDEIVILNVVADTGGGNQDITDSGITDFTGAIFIVGGVTALNTLTAHARKSLGFCDSLGNGGVIASRSENATGGVTDDRNEGSTSACVLVQSTGTAANVAVATPVARGTSGVANGIRINWSTTPDAGYRMTVILFGGTTNLAIGSGVAPASSTLVSLGWRPDLLILNSTANSLSGAALDYIIGFGGAVDDGVPSQASVYGRWDSGVATSDADAIVDTTHAGGEATGATPTYGAISIVSFSATGFNWQRTASTPAAHWFAVQFSEARVAAVAVETLPAGTGSQAFTGLGIQPSIVLGIATLIATDDTTTDGPTAATESLFAFNSTVAYALALHEEEGAGGTRATDTNLQEAAVYLDDDTGAVAVDASLVSMDATGFTLNFATATAGRMVVIGIQALIPASVIDEVVEISETVAIARTRTVPPEVVQISETVLAIPGRFALVNETIEVSEELDTYQFFLLQNASRSGSTLQSGGARASTLQNFPPNGTTL